MVVIRLTRVGKKKQAHYRIVVADSRRAVKGKFISILGWYNPHTKELQVKKDELKAWFDKGATPSNTLAKLLKKEKIELPKWIKITEKKRAPKKTEKQKDKGTEKQKDRETEEQKTEVKDTEEAKEENVGVPIEEVKEEGTDKATEEPKSDTAEAAPDKEKKKEE